LSTLWAFVRSFILDAFAVATLPQQKDRPNEAIYFDASITWRLIPLARTLILARMIYDLQHQPTTKAVHRRRMHTEQALSDLRLTTRQRSLRPLMQDFRNLPLAIARGLV
jgi:hypothetical protein